MQTSHALLFASNLACSHRGHARLWSFGPKTCLWQLTHPCNVKEWHPAISKSLRSVDFNDFLSAAGKHICAICEMSFIQAFVQPRRRCIRRKETDKISCCVGQKLDTVKQTKKKHHNTVNSKIFTNHIWKLLESCTDNKLLQQRIAGSVGRDSSDSIGQRFLFKYSNVSTVAPWGALK